MVEESPFEPLLLALSGNNLKNINFPALEQIASKLKIFSELPFAHLLLGHKAWHVYLKLGKYTSLMKMMPKDTQQLIK